MKELIIENKIIGSDQPSFIIAEIGQAHEGSLGMAHSYIDAVADVGVDAIKFQTHIAKSESTYDEKFRIKFSNQDNTRYEYWKRMEFTLDQWRELKTHANQRGLIFLSSAFSFEAFNLLNSIGMPAWKIGSGEFKSNELIEKMILTKKPILYSTGMSYWKEIDEAVDFLIKNKAEFAIFQCTSQYPTKPENVGINLIKEFLQKYNVPVGLSDHTGKFFSSLSAITLGANLIEVHVVFNKKMFGPDVSSSLDFRELSLLKEGRDAIFEYLSKPVNKNLLAEEFSGIRKLFTKSIGIIKDLKKGDILTEQLIIPKKPGTGIPFEKKREIIGKKLIKDVDSNFLLRLNDME